MYELKKRIVKYANGKVKQQGFLYACAVDGKVNVGFSLCCKADKFDKEMAEKIAIGRATSNHDLICPASIKSEMKHFLDRCQRYFKDCKVPTIED